MKYIVLDATEVEELTEKVNGLIEKGFQPLGGIAVTHTTMPANKGSVFGSGSHHKSFYQAMIKED